MAGRPTVWTPELNSKIEDCASLGASIEEIAFHAGVHRTTLYRWMEEMPELKDRIQELQERPILKARRTIVESLEEPENAKWYLERKRRKEFATRHEEEHSGGIPVQIVNYQESQDDNHSPQLSSTAIPTPLPEESGTLQDTDIPSESREVSDTPERTDPEGESY